MRRPNRPPDQRRGRNATLAAMCLALVLVVASVSSVNLALAGISVDLATTSSQLTWIADGYTVALAALVLPFGALGDRFGRRRLLLLGTVVFGAAALTASAVQSAGALIACRVVMGAGAALIMPGTLSTITAVFPDGTRARAVSIWAGFASSGAVLGLLGCGLLLEWFTWRATFVATAVLAGLSFLAALVLAPDTADPDGAAIDPVGSVLSGVGIGALVYGIIEGAEAGWTASSALTSLAIAMAALGAFAAWEWRTPTPMLDVRLFAHRGFTSGTVGLTVQFLCLFGFFLVGLQFLQLVLGYSALHSAVCLLPMAAIVMPMSRLAPHLVERFGARAVMTFGLGALGGGLAVMSRLGADSSYWHLVAGLVVFGAGMACTSTPSTTAIVSSLPRAKQGVASAVNDVSRELGSALGIAILGSLFSRGYRAAITPATDALPEEAAHAVRESPGAAVAIASQLGDAGRGLADAARHAFAAGLGDAMTVGAVLAVLSAPFTLFRGPRRAAGAPAVDPDEAVRAEQEAMLAA